MTVAELIAQLGEFDPAMPVRYLDYEQGPSDVEHVQLASERHRQINKRYPFTEPDYVSLS